MHVYILVHMYLYVYIIIIYIYVFICPYIYNIYIRLYKVDTLQHIFFAGECIFPFIARSLVGQSLVGQFPFMAKDSV